MANFVRFAEMIYSMIKFKSVGTFFKKFYAMISFLIKLCIDGKFCKILVAFFQVFLRWDLIWPRGRYAEPISEVKNKKIIYIVIYARFFFIFKVCIILKLSGLFISILKCRFIKFLFF